MVDSCVKYAKNSLKFEQLTAVWKMQRTVCCLKDLNKKVSTVITAVLNMQLTVHCLKERTEDAKNYLTSDRFKRNSFEVSMAESCLKDVLGLFQDLKQLSNRFKEQTEKKK